VSDPLHVLQLPPTANEQQIRQRYLQLVREFPPDAAPEKFAEIRAAYEALSDPRTRLRSLLFENSTETIQDILIELSRTGKLRMSTEALLNLGRGRC
jgi:curved DNA-binding protein CbpA